MLAAVASTRAPPLTATAVLLEELTITPQFTCTTAPPLADRAAAADASSNGSIQDQVRRMQQDGYLGNGTVEDVSTYQITRG